MLVDSSLPPPLYVHHICHLLPMPMPTLASEVFLVLVLLCKELVCCSCQWLVSCALSLAATLRKAASTEMGILEEEESVEDGAMSVLDLPDLALESVLARLSPAGLCRMALVCTSMRDWCRRDHLWERHLRERWGPLVGRAARREWRREVSLRKKSCSDPSGSEGPGRGWWSAFLARLCPLSWFRSDAHGNVGMRKALPPDSIMSWYSALENGMFWFPAQVYNRENGHVGFMLSCYDADLSYDRRTDTFYARFPPHGRRTVMIESGVTWDRIRVSPMTPANVLHVSDCLNELHPGNHIEIQWRRNKDFPYGWWFGVVGHMTSCDQSELHCHCHNSDTVVLEFNHYAPESRWRHAFINRKDHREEGNENDGFYGGIRKLKNEEISMWKQFWPNEMLE